ncbi:DUF4412 domain-containing protein [uncultured Croceitalea sp.]|uniref:DUF4412 domain-containing protein n=1 Tax=uncultured Croceitalea sp. TaxID=1798908 RepID=UPI0033066151
MRALKGILPVMIFCFITTGNAQFFKKLKKRVQEAAEQTAERKVAEKTERETEKTFDTVFNNKGKLFKKKKAKKLAGYSFSHKYKMQVISETDTTDITYYLTNANEYMGSSFITGKNQEFITVMDLPNAAIHTFMDLGGRKTSNSIKIDLDEVDLDEMNTNEFTISATGMSKEIIGFLCEEFQVTGPQLSGTVWVTQEADISFQKAFSQLKSKKIKRLKGIDQSWVSMVDGLTLEMKMIDYSQKKPKPIRMICTSLNETNFSIETSEYNNSF